MIIFLLTWTAEDISQLRDDAKSTKGKPTEEKKDMNITGPIFSSIMKIFLGEKQTKCVWMIKMYKNTLLLWDALLTPILNSFHCCSAWHDIIAMYGIQRLPFLKHSNTIKCHSSLNIKWSLFLRNKHFLLNVPYCLPL